MLDKLDWIVVPGGPGLSKRYLEYALTKPFSGYRLHYYDILGAPESHEQKPELSDMIEQIQQVARDLGLRDYGLITHSFGNYLAMRALERKDNKIKAIIMLNPMPFEFTLWKKALEGIVKNVSDSSLKEIQELSKNPKYGAELFQKLFPYYIRKKGATLPVDVPFDVNACNNISAKVSDYDDRKLVESCAVPLVRVVGDKDPFFMDKEFLQAKTIVIADVGHYPFFEDSNKFSESIRRVNEVLCQQDLALTKKCY